MAPEPQTETLKLSDGSAIELTRVSDADDATWEEMKAFLEANPDQAKSLQKVAKNPDAIRGFLQTRAIAEHYSSGTAQESLKALENDPELASVFDDIKKNGMEAMMKYYQDEELMLKISKKMGGLPSELQPILKKIDETPLSLHEAAKNGDLKAVQDYSTKQRPLDSQDHKGITPLGYAIAANRIAVVKLLLDSRANPFAVDSKGNSGLHYASGYGRKELVEYMLKTGANANQPNSEGQTPLSVAKMNKHTGVIEVLSAQGAH
mmetsp:Transcript_50222/g.109088  ORF Transcript_50222/g.109088 Transcript_50222/m.109088 type:complete len:263 (+) Transcript_50222:59-847(+)